MSWILSTGKDVIVDPRTILTLSLVTVFVPDIPTVLAFGESDEAVVEFVLMGCGALLLITIALRTFVLGRWNFFTAIDALGVALVAVEIGMVTDIIAKENTVFEENPALLVVKVLKLLGRICRMVTVGWQLVVLKHGSWAHPSSLASTESVALKIYEVATLRTVVLTVLASVAVITICNLDMLWMATNPAIHGELDALDALVAGGHGNTVLDSVAGTIFSKWENEDVTLLALSVKDGKSWKYATEIGSTPPQVNKDVNKVYYSPSGDCSTDANETCALLDVTDLRARGALMFLLLTLILASVIVGVMVQTHNALRHVVVKPVEQMIGALGQSASSLLEFEKAKTDQAFVTPDSPVTDMDLELDLLKGHDIVDYTVAKLAHFLSRNLDEEHEANRIKEKTGGKIADLHGADILSSTTNSVDMSASGSPRLLTSNNMAAGGGGGPAERLAQSANQWQKTSNAGWDKAQVNEATWRPVSSLATIYTTPVKAGQGPQLGRQAMRDTWGWDILGLRNKEHVMQAATKIFEAEHMLEEFNIAPAVLQCFLSEIGGRYLPNPYHNLWHGCDVMFTTWRFIQDSRAILWLTKLEVLSALVGAYAHDAGHPAVSAGFLIAVRSEIALLHNDKSPLENMHCAILFDVLRNPGAAILASLTGDEWRKFRGIVIAAILGTDMLHHFKQNSDLQLFYEVNGSLAMPLTSSEAPAVMTGDPGKRHFIIEMFVHAADISNSAKNFEIARNWAYLVVDEFFKQGEREKDLGLPVSPFMDKDITNIATMQMNFIEFMVFPLYSSLIMLFPTLSPACENLAKNVSTWGNKRIQELSSTDDIDAAGMDGAQPEKGNRDPESVQQEIMKIEVRTEALQQRCKGILKKSQTGIPT